MSALSVLNRGIAFEEIILRNWSIDDHIYYLFFLTLRRQIDLCK